MAVPTGPDLCSATVNANIWNNGGISEEEITFDTSVELTSGVVYAIVFRLPDASAASGRIQNNWNAPYANGVLVQSSNSGSSWTEGTGNDLWFQTKASSVVKDSNTAAYTNKFSIFGSLWNGQTFTASSTYTITSIALRLGRSGSPGDAVISIKDTTSAPGKATNPTPTDDQEDIAIAGSLRITTLTWNAPTDETPDYLVYFRASGGAWVLQETITDDSTSHTLSSDILDSLAYYSIYEWRVDTYDGVTELTTTGDTWTFISQVSSQYTDYTRRSDYDADKVWQPGTGWVDINTFAYTGGGRFKGRVLVVGHKVLYFGDL